MQIPFSINDFRELLPQAFKEHNIIPVLYSGFFKNGMGAEEVANNFCKNYSGNGIPMTLRMILGKIGESGMTPPANNDIASWREISKILTELCDVDPYFVAGDTISRFDNVYNGTELLNC